MATKKSSSTNAGRNTSVTAEQLELISAVINQTQSRLRALRHAAGESCESRTIAADLPVLVESICEHAHAALDDCLKALGGTEMGNFRDAVDEVRLMRIEAAND